MTNTQKDQTASLLSIELLQLYDDVTAFNEECSVMCDAFARLMSESGKFDDASISEFAQHAAWVKTRVEEFQESVHSVKEASVCFD